MQSDAELMTLSFTAFYCGFILLDDVQKVGLLAHVDKAYPKLIPRYMLNAARSMLCDISCYNPYMNYSYVSCVVTSLIKSCHIVDTETEYPVTLIFDFMLWVLFSKAVGSSNSAAVLAVRV